MKLSAQLRCMKNLFRLESNNIDRRVYSTNARQCAVVSLFRLNPEFKSKLGIKNKIISHDDFLSIIKEDKKLDKLGPCSAFDLLFMTRPVRKGDKHSGQICLPGGKLDFGENDIEGGEREFHEEMGTQLT